MPITQTTHIEHLCFNNTPIAVIEHDNEPWFTSAELAKALGYSSKDAITKIYNRNKVEFDDTDTTVISVITSADYGGCIKKKVRIFSQDGCNVIAMLAKGPRAIAFRRWVKKVLRDFRFRANSPEHFINEPIHDDFNDSPHTLDGSQPAILPLNFNDIDVPFTYKCDRLWLNCFNLAQILKLGVKNPNKKIAHIWQSNFEDMPEDGCRKINWSRIGRGSGELIFDLPTCAIIARKAGYNDYNFAAALWLQNLEQQVLKNNATKLLPDNRDAVHKARVLNNLLGENELGDKTHVHELIDGLLKPYKH